MRNQSTLDVASRDISVT